MASSDNVTITIEGTGGHGALPHRAADPVVAGSAIVMGLQSIVARNIDPQQVAIITVGAFNAGVANNVIPQTATLRLSVRSLDRDVRILLEKRITELVHAQATSYGVKAHITTSAVTRCWSTTCARPNLLAKWAKNWSAPPTSRAKVVHSRAAKTLPSCLSSCPAAIC